MASYLITGCSRGLGLAMVQQLAALPSSQVGTIIATARQRSPALSQVIDQFPSRIVYVPLDTTNVDSTKTAARETERILQEKGQGQESGLDVLINNAGVASYSPSVQEMDDLENTFNVNVVGTHNVTRAFLSLLEKGQQKKLVNISTTLGSMGLWERYAPLPTYAYKISKAALNMLTVQYAHSFADKGFTVVAISPGWLKTDLGGSIADLPVETGAEETLKIINRVTKEDNAKFFNVHVPGWENHPGINQYPGGTNPW